MGAIVTRSIPAQVQTCLGLVNHFGRHRLVRLAALGHEGDRVGGAT